MQYINKNNPKTRKEALSIIRRIIQKQWIDGEYCNLTYEELDLTEIENILVKEQQEYCCYCMRALRQLDTEKRERNVTIEHIIPNHISISDFERDKKRYSAYFTFDNKHIKVFSEGKLKDKKKRLSLPPYPHFVSYDNLVASCDGKTLEGQESVSAHHCCNNCRKDVYIPPLFYKKNVENIIRYDSKGNIDCEERYIPYFDHRALNLMTYSFNRIRRFWRIITTSEYTVEDVLNAANDEHMRHNIVEDIGDDSDSWNSLRKKIVWRLFADFSWFYQYYTKYPHL